MKIEKRIDSYGHKKLIKNLFFGIGLFYTMGAFAMFSFDAIVLITLYLLGFYIGWKFYLSIASTRKHNSQNISNQDLIYIDRILFLLVSVVFLIYLWKLNSYGIVGSEIISRKQMALLTRKDFIFSISDTVLLTVFIYHTAVLVHFNKSRTFFYKCSLLICILIAVSSISLTSMMIIFITQLFFIDKNKPISRYVLLLMIPGYVLSVIWKPLASYIFFNSRLLGIDELSIPSEFTSWVSIYNNITSEMHNWNPSRYGESYIETLQSLILPFSEVNTLSVTYLKTYEPLVYQTGGGRGFSFFLEAFVNFGYLGVIMIGILVGLTLCKSSYSSSKGVIQLFIYILLCTLVFKFFRSESLALVKNLFWLQIIPGLLLHSCLHLFLGFLPRRKFNSVTQ